ncbi:MAG: hypothetical protein ACTHK4_10825 [Mycobacteriales bacterium]
MSTDDRDQAMEQRLREALAAHADSVQPGGDGLMRIQQRIGVRRARDRWLRPVTVLGAVVVVAAVAIGGVAIARSGNGAKVSPLQSQTPTPTANPVATDSFPAQGFFPFSTAAEEASWEQEFAGGHSPWISDPTAVTESWVTAYLKERGSFTFSAQTNGSTSDVTASRGIGGTDHPVAIVHLVKFHHAWIVTGAGSAQGDLVIASPAPGATGSSPLTVSGPGFGVEERATVEIRDGETPTLLGQAKTGMFGGGTEQWSASPAFTPSKSGVGVIGVSIASPADGDVGEFTAQKVVFGASPSATSGGSFYGVSNGEIEKFSGGGTPQGTLVDSSNGPVTEVQSVGDTLFFTTRPHGCDVDTISSRAAAGEGPTAQLTTSSPGYEITGFSVSADGTKVAYFQTGCGSHAGQGQLVIDNLTTGHTHAVDFANMPPAITGDPVWESDGVHVDAFVRTGMSGYLARYDSTQGNNATPNTNACPGFDVNSGLPGALTTTPDGTLWFAVQTGTSMQVLSCAGGTPKVETTVTDTNDTPASLSVNSSGDVLLADISGHVWNVTPGGTEAALTGSVITSVTW